MTSLRHPISWKLQNMFSKIKIDGKFISLWKIVSFSKKLKNADKKYEFAKQSLAPKIHQKIL